MTKILFERRAHVYLPELSAYKAYIETHFPHVSFDECPADDPVDPSGYDVVWRFPGLDFKGKGKFVVHEYNSLSTGHFAVVKNRIKSSLNATPDLRIFLSGIVKDGFSFSDGVPNKIRDMGINQSFFSQPSRQPDYDFVCTGGLNRGGLMPRFLDLFSGVLRESSVLLIGECPKNLATAFQGRDNIVFTGKVNYEDIPQIVTKGRYGLNLMPDIYPFNCQTATKVLEYCALGMPVVSTRYAWAETFQRDRNGSFFWLDNDLKNLTMGALEQYDFKVPDVSDLGWNQVITESRIFDFLK